MRVVLSGGGSGGHILPLIAVAEKIRKKAKERGIQEIEFLYIGPRFGEESDEMFKHAGIKYKYILAGKIRRYSSGVLLNVFDIFFSTPIGIIQSAWYLFWFMPEVVFSKGGYGSVPVMIIAWIYNIPVRMIHESDAVVGLANKFLAFFATKIGVAFKKAALAFPLKKTALVGVPIREDLCNKDKTLAKKIFNINSEREVILIFGGSQGSKKINDVVVEALPELLEKYEVLHITGPKHYSFVKEVSKLTIKENSKYYHIFPFLTEEMGYAISIADIVISRAGASTIFELAACQKASIIIPLKNSAQNHQRENAYEYAKSGGTIVIEEENLTPHILITRIKEILEYPNNRKKIETNAGSFAILNSTDIIAEEIFKSLGI